VSSFAETRKYSPETIPYPRNLGSSWHTPPDSSEPWHVLPCSASAVRASEKVQLRRIGSRIRVFHRAINQGSNFYAAPNILKMGIRYLNLSSFIQFSTIKDEKSAAKFHYIKTVSSKVVAHQLPFEWYQYTGRGRPLPSEILAETDPPPPGCSEFWHILPCSASTLRDNKRSSITLNKYSTRAFQWAINQGSTPPLTSSKWR